MKIFTIFSLVFFVTAQVAFAGKNDDCAKRNNNDRTENARKVSERVASVLGKPSPSGTEEGRTNR